MAHDLIIPEGTAVAYAFMTKIKHSFVQSHSRVNIDLHAFVCYENSCAYEWENCHGLKNIFLWRAYGEKAHEQLLSPAHDHCPMSNVDLS